VSFFSVKLVFCTDCCVHQMWLSPGSLGLAS